MNEVSVDADDDLDIIDLEIVDNTHTYQGKILQPPCQISGGIAHVPTSISPDPNPYFVGQQIRYSGGMLRHRSHVGSIIAIHGEYLAIDWTEAGSKPKHQSELIPWVEVKPSA